MSKLGDFWAQVMKFVALSDELQDSPTDSNGECPIVVALGEESVTVLHERVSAAGGNATIFVLDSTKGAVRVASAIDANCALHSDHADQLTVPETGDSSISMLLDHLASQSSGVCLNVQGTGPRVENVREVEFA